MFHGALQPAKKRISYALSAVLVELLVLSVTLVGSRPAEALPVSSVKVRALPAFARKYGMPCSACHLGWPMLSAFGQAFKDNGYQLGNERDAPIYSHPSYWPVTFRITPNWHRESQNRVAADDPNNPGGSVEAKITTHGFDWSGLDFHTAGTLAKNISFYVLPSSDNTGAFHFESVWGRLDNVLGSSWFNIKLGKFELDNLLSEKRILTLTNVAGTYANYHFQPYLPTSRGYDGYFAASQAFQVGSLGLQRVGGFAYLGEAPTYFQYNQSGVGVPGTGIGNKSFYRAGLIGQWYVKKIDVTTIFFHGWDSAFLGSNTAANTPLPDGAQSPTWNGGLFETHYTLNPQLVLINRYELIRMSRQVFATNPANFGNEDVLTFGYRYYPFISSRAGFAFHNEYAIMRQRGAAPISGLDLTTSSLLIGFDFAF